MIIRVTAEDIRDGKRNDSKCCPVALACLRQINRNWLEVWLQLIRKEDTDSVEIQVKGFIRDFDNYNPVEPFEFNLPKDLFV